jgi:hypothetical protein
LISADKDDFLFIMKNITSLYQKKEYDTELLRIWWSKLRQFDIKVVSVAFDKWVDNNKYLPLPADIIGLCKAQEARHFATALPKPTHTPEQIKENQDRLNRELAKIKPKRDNKAWAKDIIKTPEMYPDISLRFAKEALHIME